MYLVLVVESMEAYCLADVTIFSNAKVHPRTTKCTLERKMVKVPRAPACHSR